jgi:transcriptional regulator with XRE-family HTH domain
MNKHTTNRKIKLLKSGIKEVEIAKMLGVSRQAINNEMRGVRKSRRVRDALCKLTNTPFEKFFPEYAQKEADSNVG